MKILQQLRKLASKLSDLIIKPIRNRLFRAGGNTSQAAPPIPVIPGVKSKTSDYIPKQEEPPVKVTGNKKAYDASAEDLQILDNVYSYLGDIDGNLGLWLQSWFKNLVERIGQKEAAEAIKKMPNWVSAYFDAYMPDYKRVIEEFTDDLLYYLGGDTIMADKIRDLADEAMWDSSYD